MTYQEVLDYLFSQMPAYQLKGAKAYKANLDNIHQLSEQLNRPEQKFKSIHVAGTNGKGSCSHMIASVFQEAGYKTGLYTSPHLKDFRERIRINGEMISEEDVITFVEKNRSNFEQIGLSFFEWTVGLAFAHFAKNKVDIAIIETGLGGRLDATNIITPELSIITNIGIDHTQFLGNTLPLIAGEKAGIIKPNVPVVIGETHPETAPVFENKAKECSSELTFADQQKEINILSSDLKGSYQKKNIKTVLTAFQQLQKNWPISNTIIAKGLMHVVANTGLLGRWQTIQESPLVIADTAHNKEGLTYTLQQLTDTPHNELHIVWGMVSDKDISEIIEMLPKKAKYYLAAPNISRAMPIEKMEVFFKQHNLNFATLNSISGAYKTAIQQASNDDVIYVGGSTFVVAEIL